MELCKPFFAVTTKCGTKRLRTSEILYFERDLRKIHVHTTEGIFSYYGEFDNLGSRLDGRFCRCHCSYVVNLDKVTELRRNALDLEDGEVLKVSQTFYRNTRICFLAYLK